MGELDISSAQHAPVFHGHQTPRQRPPSDAREPAWGQWPLQGSMGHFENRSSVMHPEANLTDASRVLQRNSRVFNWPITQLEID
jgi:hypothetical protein